MINDHALLAPSAAPVWAHCSGSVMANQMCPQPETESTRAGTAAHWVVETCLRAWQKGEQLEPQAMKGQAAPNGVVVDDEMVDAADVHITDVKNTVGPENLLIEHRVYASEIDKDCWGTLDTAAIDGYTIYLWDFKFGHGRVEAEENYQSVSYLRGLLEMMGLNGLQDQHYRVVSRIVQPRCYDGKGPIREWRLALSGIRGYVNQLKHQAHLAKNNPTLCSGAHCRYCPARGANCPAFRQATYNMIDIFDMPLNFDVMQGADLKVEREILQRGVSLLKARLESIEDVITHKVKQGDKSIGLALESVPGSAKWSGNNAAVRGFAGMFGIDVNVDKVLTPTQSRAKLKKEQREQWDAMVKQFTKRDSKIKLIEASDTIAAKTFGK